MGLIAIPTFEIDEIRKALNLIETTETIWEKAVDECYKNKYMIRCYKDWTIVIGQTENLVSKFFKESENLKERKDNFLELLKKLSQKFGRVSYNFNSSKYGVFEEYKCEGGKLVSIFIHEDGDEKIEGGTEEEYFNDFKSLCYDKTILNGVKLYE